MLFTGVALGSFRVGGMLASAFFCVALTMCLAITIIALVGRGELRVFAIGFVVPLVVYVGVHGLLGATELDPYRGALPTTKLMRPMLEAVVKREWVDGVTGAVIPDYNPATMPIRHQGGVPLPPGISPVTIRETPNRTTFTLLVHTWLAILAAYAGGKFAVVVRRYQDLQYSTAASEADEKTKANFAPNDNGPDGAEP